MLCCDEERDSLVLVIKGTDMRSWQIDKRADGVRVERRRSLLTASQAEHAGSESRKQGNGPVSARAGGSVL